MKKFQVVHLDNHLLLVNKPAGLATQPSPTSNESLELHCKNWVKEQFAKPGNVFLQPIHRLDKPVSGLVLFARTSKALSRLNGSMRAGQMHKTYQALVEGNVLPLEGKLEHYLLHGDHYAHIVSADTKGAKRAILRYRLKEQHENTSLLEIDLETGRYHQIRAQLSAFGHPIVGDSKYGSKLAFKGDGIALAHVRFSFPHPISNELLSFELSSIVLNAYFR